jgi:hypothetical protein
LISSGSISDPVVLAREARAALRRRGATAAQVDALRGLDFEISEDRRGVIVSLRNLPGAKTTKLELFARPAALVWLHLVIAKAYMGTDLAAFPPAPAARQAPLRHDRRPVRVLVASALDRRS